MERTPAVAVNPVKMTLGRLISERSISPQEHPALAVGVEPSLYLLGTATEAGLYVGPALGNARLAPALLYDRTRGPGSRVRAPCRHSLL